MTARKSAALRLVDGDVGKQRKKSVGVSPPSRRPVAPPGMGRPFLQEWTRVVKNLEARGVALAPDDRDLISVYVAAWMRWRELIDLLAVDGFVIADAKGSEKKHPALQTLRECETTMTSLSQRFGFDPRSRADLGADAGGVVDDWDRFT